MSISSAILRHFLRNDTKSLIELATKDHANYITTQVFLESITHYVGDIPYTDQQKSYAKTVLDMIKVKWSRLHSDSQEDDSHPISD